MKDKYDIAVVIGRFQPIHKGHIPAFKRANDIADKTICVIGSANKPSSPKDPLSAEERENLIRTVISKTWKKWTSYSGEPEFVHVEDTFYLEQEWYSRVKEGVEAFIPEILEAKKERYKNILRFKKNQIQLAKVNSDDIYAMENHVGLHGIYDSTSSIIQDYLALKEETETCHIAVLGHEKDESSYYLKNFADWDLIDIGSWVGDFQHDKPISATDIRNLWFSGLLSYAQANLHETTYNYLLEFPDNRFLDLKEEFEFLDLYKAKTQQGSFPVQFLTTDAVVIHGDEILLVRRGGFPGKGLWALPGGFKDNNEPFFKSCVRELIEETRIALPEKVLIGSKKEEKIFDYPGRSARGTTVSMAYSFILDPAFPRPRVKGGDDAVEAHWFSLSKVKKMRDQLFEDHPDIIEYMTARI